MDWPSEDVGSSATVFVRGLPYTWTDLDLSAHFEHIGPVRRSFIIHHKRTNTSKGFGFVQFALHDDATRAVDDMDGKEVGGEVGRKLRVEMAVERGKEGEGQRGKGKGAGVGEKRKEQAAKVEGDSGRKRQKVDKEAVAEKEESKWPLELHEIQEEKETEAANGEVGDDGDSETSEEDLEEAEEEEDKSLHHTTARTRSTQRLPQTASDELDQLKEEEQTSDMDGLTITDDHFTPTPPPSTASHALLVSGIPPSTTSSELDAVLKQHSLCPTLLVFPAPESTLKKRAARLTFPSASAASRAASLLSSITLSAASHPLRCVALPINAARVIVRNLPLPHRRTTTAQGTVAVRAHRLTTGACERAVGWRRCVESWVRFCLLCADGGCCGDDEGGEWCTAVGSTTGRRLEPRQAAVRRSSGDGREEREAEGHEEGEEEGGQDSGRGRGRRG